MSDTIPSEPPVNPQPAQSSTRAWEVLCHAASLLGLILGFASIPFVNILGPLIVWLMKRSESIGVDVHGKESLNFQISWTLWGIGVSIILIVSIVGLLLLAFLLMAFLVLSIVLTIMASVKASNGEVYRYPLTIRFIK